MKRAALVLAILGALAAPALAHASAPPIARPNPVTYPIRLDYESPLPGPHGSAASLAALEPGVIMAETRDQAYLAFEKLDDLGGFVPATIGRLTLTSGGHDVLSPGVHKAQIPLFQQAAGGKIQSFTFTGNPTGTTPPPDNGNGSGVTPPPPPTPAETVPPANQGFGGQPTGSGNGSGSGSTQPGGTTTTTRGGGGGGGGTTTTKPPPTTTTSKPPSTTTTTTTTTVAGTATTSGGSGGGGGSGCSGGTCAAGSCGTAGIQIDSNPSGCVLALANAAPGDSISEVMTVTNTTGSPYTLAFKAIGPNNNHVWQDLEMDVFDPLVGPAFPMPSLQSWLGSFHSLGTLNPGQSVQYEIELYLPTTAGNEDQGKTAVVAFLWQGLG